MKTQLYSPEGRFQTIWSTPDRLPHKSLWLWDSVFHALGHQHISHNLAEDLVRAIWVHQEEDGFIPHRANPSEISEITQPPIIAWGVWKLYQNTKNSTFLKEAYANNKRFLDWCRKHRRLRDKELYTWNTGSDMHCRCDESGMDNSPRFDTQEFLFAIDYSSFMANEVGYMQKIALELNLPEEAEFYKNWYAEISNDINTYLWSEEDSFYFDYVISQERLHKVWSVASFLPLLAGVCSEDQAKKLVEHLKDEKSFASPFPIPSISKKDPSFGSDMWRGPVWINYNYMICQGLRNYKYDSFADEIIEKTKFYVNYWYQLTGSVFEFYDSNQERSPQQLNRKGKPFEPYNIDIRLQSIRDYGWSCTLLFDLLNQE